MQFNEFKFCSEIISAIEQKGYSEATPIQAQAIPPILAGHDLMATAQTGTGKTAAFCLPILQLLQQGQVKAQGRNPRALVLAPTRELALQVSENLVAYGSQLEQIRCDLVYGGVNIMTQMQRLSRGVDCLVATPGRLLDLQQRGAISLKQLEILVLDEADRMLDMGFIHDIRKLMSLLPKQRQTLLFSATFSKEIRKLALDLLVQPKQVDLAPNNSAAKTVKQSLYVVDKRSKPALLKYLYKHNEWGQVLAFCRTKRGANQLTRYLQEQGIEAAAIHGNKSQNTREKALEGFKNKEVQILVATDIAARGIDIDRLPQVVNVDLPTSAEDYVHRIGRTGRAGEKGEAVSFVCATEYEQLLDIQRLIGKTLEQEVVEGFEPKNELPKKPIKAKPKARPKTANSASKSKPRNTQGKKPLANKKPSTGKKPLANKKPLADKPSNSSTKNNTRGDKPQSSPNEKSSAWPGARKQASRPPLPKPKSSGGNSSKRDSSARSGNPSKTVSGAKGRNKSSGAKNRSSIWPTS